MVYLLCDSIQKVSSPTRGLPYYALSAVSFYCLLTVVLSGAVLVFFCFSNAENILICLWMQFTFLCTKPDNIHLSQRMEYHRLLIWIPSEGSVPDGANLVSVSRMHSRQKYFWQQDMDLRANVLHQIASLQPRVKPHSSVTILLRLEGPA